MRRTALALAAAATVFAGQSAHAAAKPLVLTDLTGDANGVNSQAIGLPLPSTSTAAASLKGADIVSLTLSNVFKGKGRQAKPAGMTVTLKLNGAIQEGVNFVVTMDTSTPCGASNTMQFGYSSTPALDTSLANCQSSEPGADDAVTVGSTSVDAANGVITWTVDGGTLTKGAKVTDIQASSTVFVLGVFDDLLSDKTFTYGV